MDLLVKGVLKVGMVCLVLLEQRENQVTPVKYFHSTLQLFFSAITVTRIIWKELLRSFCGAKAKFLSGRLCMFFYVIFVHAVNNPNAL